MAGRGRRCVQRPGCRQHFLPTRQWRRFPARAARQCGVAGRGEAGRNQPDLRQADWPEPDAAGIDRRGIFEAVSVRTQRTGAPVLEAEGLCLGRVEARSPAGHQRQDHARSGAARFLGFRRVRECRRRLRQCRKPSARAGPDLASGSRGDEKLRGLGERDFARLWGIAAGRGRHHPDRTGRRGAGKSRPGAALRTVHQGDGQS